MTHTTEDTHKRTHTRAHAHNRYDTNNRHNAHHRRDARAHVTQTTGIREGGRKHNNAPGGTSVDTPHTTHNIRQHTKCRRARDG